MPQSIEPIRALVHLGPALSFQNVTKRFGKNTLALNDVTWSIQRGARACLLGPNGAGKSTSIRLLQGALRPTAGQVDLLGAAVDGRGYWEARVRTGIVPQGPGMYTDLTTLEYLTLAQELYRTGNEKGRVDDAVEALGLGPFRDQMLSNLSGGYQRRVSLAAALLTEPELLLLDEPTVGLDPVATHDVHTLLRDAMNHPDRTTLLCTHNLAEAEALCDEVVILRDGRVVVHDTLDRLRQRARPQVRFAARQGGAALAAALVRHGVEAVQDDRDDDVARASLEQPAARTPDLLRALLADGLDVYGCTPIEPRLEDIFLDVVGNEPRPARVAR